MRHVRDLYKQQRRQLPKRHLKSEFTLINFIALTPSCLLCQCWQMFLELNSKRLYQSSGKEKESRCLMFTSSTKREFRHFHLIVVQRRQKMYKKAWCTWKLLVLLFFFFANLNLLLFCRSRCCRRRRCLSSHPTSRRRGVRGGHWTKFYTGSSAPRSNPLTHLVNTIFGRKVTSLGSHPNVM